MLLRDRIHRKAQRARSKREDDLPASYRSNAHCASRETIVPGRRLRRERPARRPASACKAWGVSARVCSGWKGLRVGDLVGGDEPRPQRREPVEGLSRGPLLRRRTGLEAHRDVHQARIAEHSRAPRRAGCCGRAWRSRRRVRSRGRSGARTPLAAGSCPAPPHVPARPARTSSSGHLPFEVFLGAVRIELKRPSCSA